MSKKKAAVPPLAVPPPDLARYEGKRDFLITPEPPPGPAGNPRVGPPRFMVHKHDARRLHYDLRLEIDGALASWAVPRGPSYDPRERRFAVQTEDHPMAYGDFEGRIPDGQYGAGDAVVWDQGVFETFPPGQSTFMRNKGHLDLVLLGDKLKGRWHLIRTRKPGAKPGGKAKSEWLLFKAKDEFASETYDVVAERPESVVSGKRLTRGPTPAAVKRAAGGDPVALLVKIWPPALPTVVPTTAVLSSGTHLVEGLTRGPRAVAAVSHKRPALQSEQGRDLAALFPEIAAALAGVIATEAVLDGEIADERPPRFIAHDLLWLDGRDVRARPIEERRELLVGVVPADDPRLACTPVFMGSGADARAAARAAGYARVLAKKLGSGYVAGEGPDWLVFDDTADQGDHR